MKCETVKLGEYLYIKGRIGWKGLKKNEYLDNSEYRIINGETLTADGIDWSKAGYITEERYMESPEIMLQVNDILISKDGTIGKIGYVDKLDMPTTVASGIFVIRNEKPEIIDTKFIYHFLRSPYLKAFIEMRTEGSVIPHLYQKDFVDLDFPLYPLEIQQKISSMLNVLDDKIALNKEINNNLLQQMKVAYLSAKQNSLCRHCSFDEILEFYDNLRKPLSSKQREDMEQIYPYYGATSIVDYVDNYIFEGTYILVSEDGANVVDINGYPLLQYTYGRFWVNNHAHIVKGKNGISNALAYAILSTTNLQSIVTGAAQPKINQANLRNFKIEIPPSSIVSSLNEVVEPMLEIMITNDIENSKLTNIRNCLLPKLMANGINIANIDI